MNADAAGRELHDAATRAARLFALLRLLECAAVGSLGGAIVLAAGLASGAEVARELGLVSFVVAVLTLVLAWRERPPRASDLLRRADQTAGLEGALPAALDATRGERKVVAQGSVDIAAALVRRVRTVIGPRQLARAAWPRSPLVFAAPLLGAALVACAWEARPRIPTPSSYVVDVLRDAAAASRAAGAALTADELEIEARRLEVAQLHDPSASFASASARALLERLAETAAVSDSARAALERAADRLAEGKNTSASVSGALQGGPGSSADSPEAGARSTPRASASGTSTPATLANGAPDGRMFGPPAGGEPYPDSGGPANGTIGTGGPGRGAPSARWWPSRYDDVVARYLAR